MDGRAAAMSDTPRTDAEVKNTGFAKGHGFVPADFARQLERELREATKCKHPNRQGMTDGLGKFTEYCTQCHAETTALNEGAVRPLHAGDAQS